MTLLSTVLPPLCKVTKYFRVIDPCSGFLLCPPLLPSPGTLMDEILVGLKSLLIFQSKYLAVK